MCKCVKLSDLFSHAETKKHKISCGVYAQANKLPFKPSNQQIGITKLLGIVILYFSEKNKQIVSTFLSMARLEMGNAKGIIKSLKNVLQVFKLNIQKMIGIGTDNASVMTGCNHSVYTELKKDVPNLMLIRCVCHSIQLAINHSCKESLPTHLEFLVHETYNWFSMSFSRLSSYKQLYETLNNGRVTFIYISTNNRNFKNYYIKIHNFLGATKNYKSYCDTRWLSIAMAVSRTLEQWLELKTHFSISRSSEKCYTANTLYQMFSDNTNYLYLLFLKPILSEIQVLNNSFQSNTSDATKLLNDLMLVINSLKSKIINPAQHRLDIITNNFDNYIDRTCYLGYRFENQVDQYRKEKTLDERTEKIIRIRCTDFIVSLIKQLKQRLPENYEILKKIDLISVNNVLKHVKEDLSPILITFEKNPEIRERKIQQYQNINYIKWMNVSNTSLFWTEVHSYRV